MRYKSVLALAALAFLGAACDDETPVTGNALLAGAWQYTSGDNLKLSSGADLKYLSIDAAGTGTLVYQNTAQTEILYCGDFDYSVVSDTALLFTPQFVASDTFFNTHQEFTVSDTTLTISENGMEAVFTKVASVPAEFTCQKFSAVTVKRGLPDPYYFGLAYDGTKLWYLPWPPSGSSWSLLPFNPTTMEAGTMVDWSSNAPQAFQGADVWTVQAMGGTGQTASRRTMGDVENLAIDTTVAPFSDPLSIYSMAWDGTNLWMAGWDSATTPAFKFVKVDVVAGTKLDEKAFATSVRAFTWDGQYFWGLLAGDLATVVKIDPATFKVVANYSIPTEANARFPQWNGIAAVGSDIFLLGQDMYNYGYGSVDSTLGMIVKVTP